MLVVVRHGPMNFGCRSHQLKACILHGPMISGLHLNAEVRHVTQAAEDLFTDIVHLQYNPTDADKQTALTVVNTLLVCSVPVGYELTRALIRSPAEVN